MNAREILVTAIAVAAHEKNRLYCESIGDTSQVPWDEASEWQKSSSLMGVRKVLSGDITTPAQAHESWMKQKLDEGWRYGSLKDAEALTHPCIVPYERLPPEQRIKDCIFFSTVLECAKALGV